MSNLLDTNFPVGKWDSYLGGGNDMHTWISLSFHQDGTGLIEEFWGVEPEGPERDPFFKWKLTESNQIQFEHAGKMTSVAFTLKETKNEYNITEMRMYEKIELTDHCVEGFWISPYSLVYQEPIKKRWWNFLSF